MNIELQGSQPVSASTIIQMAKTLNPKIELVNSRKQGSTDLGSGGVVARLNWAMQLLVHFGKLDFANDNTQPQFSKDLLSSCINHIIFWDEMHEEDFWLSEQPFILIPMQ